MPDDVFGLQELLGTLVHSQIVVSQDDLHGIGAEKEGETCLKNVEAEHFLFLLILVLISHCYLNSLYLILRFNRCPQHMV